MNMKPWPAITSYRLELLNQLIHERRAQIEGGNTPELDAAHVDGELAQAACYFAWPKSPSAYLWPDEWDHNFAIKHDYSRRDQLMTAAAFILAEVERLDRAAGVDVDATPFQWIQSQDGDPPDLPGAAP